MGTFLNATLVINERPLNHSMSEATDLKDKIMTRMNKNYNG